MKYIQKILIKAFELIFKSKKKKEEVIANLIESSIKKLPPKEKLKFLFNLENNIYRLEGKSSVEYGGGLHTKHKHTKYHEFFTENIEEGSKVLDIGCGNGYLSYDIASKVTDVYVLGIDISEKNIAFAKKRYKRKNLKFVCGDALKDLPKKKFDTVVLSNVLEHIEERVNFLKMINKQVKPNKFLIRVPKFDRDWRVPLKKEIGVDWRLDKTHFTEYTKDSFEKEIQKAGLKPIEMKFKWGEIWSIIEPLN